MAKRSRLGIALAPPLIDQVRDQAAPSSLVASAKAHTGIGMVILVEEEAILPVRVLLKLCVRSEYWASAVGILFENTDHAICNFTCHAMG